MKNKINTELISKKNNCNKCEVCSCLEKKNVDFDNDSKNNQKDNSNNLKR
ncbi:hypothetical protein GCM10008022_37710 [Paenibacillus hunanensis]|uniref:Uncharacterized protein n=1 Tax=Paenibacillus hunanensis TaxID=539262 RepID=A0ABU1IY46_9BACL|nr:hypothetical protein [Paenibacillus hunanensis]GGJ25262.1 hypothetical protein GCM10008022_37710 [Paenibacillus hunanensis]